MEAGDDDVVARQQLVGVVELAVHADLQLAAVQQAEAIGMRALGHVAGSLLACKALVQLGDDRALAFDTFDG